MKLWIAYHMKFPNFQTSMSAEFDEINVPSILDLLFGDNLRLVAKKHHDRSKHSDEVTIKDLLSRTIIQYSFDNLGQGCY